MQETVLSAAGLQEVASREWLRGGKEDYLRFVGGALFLERPCERGTKAWAGNNGRNEPRNRRSTEKLEALCAPEREAAHLDKYRMLLFMHALGVQLSRTVRARGRQVDEADLSRR